MDHQKETFADEAVISPLKLLYTAYADNRPVVNQVLEEALRELEEYLPRLPEQGRRAVFQTLCKLCEEKEQAAFQAGVRSGFRLAEELREAE